MLARQMLWAAVSDFPEGVALLMECGCNANVALDWLRSFDLLQQVQLPQRRKSVQEFSAKKNQRDDISPRRRQAIVGSSSCSSALQAIKLIEQCLEYGGNTVHRPAVAHSHAAEHFSSPAIADVKWTCRVRGVSMQVNFRRCSVFPCS
jgi:hypothetical protein